MSCLRLIAVAVAAIAVTAAGPFASAAVTPAQRQELAEINEQITEASQLLRKKQVDEAEEALDAAEERLETLLDGDADKLLARERLVGIIQKNIAARRRTIALQRGERPQADAVSFSDDVAPIVKDNCLNCHGGDNPRGRLRLDTFAGWKQGGASRQPLVRVLLPRLTAPNPQQRMPRGEAPLAATELETIARWLQQGAAFDGAGDDAPIGEKGDDGEAPTIAKPEGGETVSFVNDVAPFMVNICGRCHMREDPRGGFNMTTFEGVMRGGESGQVIEPGDPDASRLWLMVSNKEQPRMPPGQLLITPTNYESLTTWIKEGAKFDGDDPKRPLRDLIPSAGEMRSKELDKLSPEEFVAHRRERSEAHWKRAFPKETAVQVETDQFFFYGNVAEERLKQVAGWADEQAVIVRSTFAAKDSTLWKGKLAVFVVEDRFGYEEFALAVNERMQVPAEIHGHVVMTPGSDDAYVVLEDVGDEASATSPGLQAHVANHVAQAYLLRDGSKLPDWAVQGTGLQFAAKASPGNPYFSALRSGVDEALKNVKQPEQVFADGTFPPAQVASVGYALVDYMTQAGGAPKYAQFLARLSESGDAETAIQGVYRTTPAGLATGFVQHAAKRR